MYALDGSEEFEFMETRVFRYKKKVICTPYPLDVSKIDSMWTPLTSRDCDGILIAFHALDESEDFEFMETRVFM